MQSKHFHAGLLFVIVAGFIALVASIFLIVISSFGNHDSIQGHDHNKILVLKPKSLNSNRLKSEINQSISEDAALKNSVYLPKQCGFQTSRSGSGKIGHPIYTRIIGGREALPNNYPWVNIYFFIGYLDLA